MKRMNRFHTSCAGASMLAAAMLFMISVPQTNSFAQQTTATSSASAQTTATSSAAAQTTATTSATTQTTTTAQSAVAAPQAKRIRKPAVAGTFYPNKGEAISEMIDDLMVSAHVEPIANLRALIVPHADYRYSGGVAAAAYKLLTGRHDLTVFILGPAHHAAITGAVVPDVDAFETPMGVVDLSPKAKLIAAVAPFSLEKPVKMKRPPYASFAEKSSVPYTKDTADTWEHSVEVQVPFLQKMLRNFTIVPIVFGRVTPQTVAETLTKQLDDNSLIIVSTDLSHYHSYEAAKEADERCVKAITALDIPTMEEQEACGNVPILALMHIAKKKGWQAKLLDLRNSGDTGGDKTSVVGYTAIAFFDPAGRSEAPATPAAQPRAVAAQSGGVQPSLMTQPQQKSKAGAFSLDERKQLLGLARQTVTGVVKEGRLPAVEAGNFPG